MLCKLAFLAVCVALVACEDESVQPRWRKKYDALFDVQKFGQPAKNPMNSTEAQQVMEELSALLETEPSIPHDEREEVEFWSKAANFEADDCNKEREQELQKHYRTRLASFSVARPNLQVYLKQLRSALLEYCVRIQPEIVVKPIEKLSAEDRAFISSLGTNEYPPALQTDQIAAHLAPFYVEPVKNDSKKPDLVEDTKEIYRNQIGQVCDRATDLPKPVKDAVRYFEHNDAIDRLNPIVKEWARIKLICELMPNYMDFIAILAPIQIRYKYQRM